MDTSRKGGYGMHIGFQAFARSMTCAAYREIRGAAGHAQGDATDTCAPQAAIL
jgi:hypothetical protein